MAGQDVWNYWTKHLHDYKSLVPFEKIVVVDKDGEEKKQDQVVTHVRMNKPYFGTNLHVLDRGSFGTVSQYNFETRFVQKHFHHTPSLSECFFHMHVFRLSSAVYKDPCIAPVRAFGASYVIDPPNPVPTMILDAAKHKSMYHFFRSQPKRCLDRALLTKCCYSMLKGLLVMTKYGLYHSDIKPQNVFVYGSEKEPNVRIGDFGVVQISHPFPHLPSDRVPMTKLYRAPELLALSLNKRGKHSKGKESDKLLVMSSNRDITRRMVWAVAMSIWMVMQHDRHTEATKYHGKSSHILRWMCEILKQKYQVPSLSTKDILMFATETDQGVSLYHNPGSSDELDDFLERALTIYQPERMVLREAFYHPVFKSLRERDALDVARLHYTPISPFTHKPISRSSIVGYICPYYCCWIAEIANATSDVKKDGVFNLPPSPHPNWIARLMFALIWVNILSRLEEYIGSTAFTLSTLDTLERFAWCLTSSVVPRRLAFHTDVWERAWSSLIACPQKVQDVLYDAPTLYPTHKWFTSLFQNAVQSEAISHQLSKATRKAQLVLLDQLIYGEQNISQKTSPSLELYQSSIWHAPYRPVLQSLLTNVYRDTKGWDSDTNQTLLNATGKRSAW